MRDGFGRTINYMRISLTDRCNLRCCYCRSERQQLLPHSAILTYEEILKICQIAVELGIRRFRVTGGEPLVRRDCIKFLRLLKNLPGAEQVSLTTNGTLLHSSLSELQQLGLDSINISMDTLDRQRYAQLTGADLLPEVLSSVQAARKNGLKVKINCVPLDTMSEQDLLAMTDFAAKLQIPIRFIELMPLGCNQSLQGLSGETVRSILAKHGRQLLPDQGKYGSGPAVYYRETETNALIGFIQPLHGKFCAACNRVRLTATGFLKTCLYSDQGLNLRRLLRSGKDENFLRQEMLRVIKDKPDEHHFLQAPAAFTMNEIGG